MDAATYVAELLVWSTAQVVWQAALACMIFAVWTSIRKPSAQQRYMVAIMMLASLPVLLIATAVVTHASLVLNARQGALGAVTAHSSESLAMISAIFERAAAALPVLFAIWCAGVALAATRMIAERRELRAVTGRLRSAPPEIAARVGALAAKAGVRNGPRVLVGDLASGAPFVAGARHALLVLPAVPLTQDEWNAVVLHELAHIRRHDYAASYAVQVLNAVLWFHPCVPILARWAAQAREECCDADAARTSAAPVALARALVRIAEHDTHRIRAVAAMSGSLIDRVRRVLADDAAPSRGHRSTLAPLLTACAVYAMGIAACCTVAPSLDSLAVTGASAALLPSQLVLIHAVDPAGHFTLTALNGRVAMATIGGVPVARSALRVDGERVTVLSTTGQPALSLNFDPRGALTWNARRPPAKITSRE